MSNVQPVPPMPQGGGAPMEPPAEQGFPGIDMNDPIAKYFMRNMDALDEADIQALATGITPPVAAALSKVMPNLAPVWEFFGSDADASAMPGGAPMGAAPPPGAGAPGAAMNQRPASPLSQI